MEILEHLACAFLAGIAGALVASSLVAWRERKRFEQVIHHHEVNQISLDPDAVDKLIADAWTRQARRGRIA
jgi:hypothetical protein